MSYLVHLQKFEGPLGLLLFLIRKEEMNIFDININEITKQYLEYIRLMRELDLEVAGEFVAMAATLLQIKSRMLLPQYNEQGEEVEKEDPRKELVQKLLDYQRYQEGAKQLYSRPLLGRDLFVRGSVEDFIEDEGFGPIITEDDALFSLIRSYRSAVKKMKKTVHKVRAKGQSIAQRVLEIKDRLIVGQKVLLTDLVTATEPFQARLQLLITFLSSLELTRMGFVSVYQNEIYGDIYIETKKEIERNVLERVQEFDAQDADEVVRQMMEDAIETLAVEEQARAEDDREEKAKIQAEAERMAEGLASGSGESDLLAMQTVDLEIEAELQKEESLFSADVGLEGDTDADVGLESKNGGAAEIADGDAASDEFVLTDAEDRLTSLNIEALAQRAPQEFNALGSTPDQIEADLMASGEMASDEDILLAELELDASEDQPVAATQSAGLEKVSLEVRAEGSAALLNEQLSDQLNDQALEKSAMAAPTNVTENMPEKISENRPETYLERQAFKTDAEI